MRLSPQATSGSPAFLHPHAPPMTRKCHSSCMSDYHTFHFVYTYTTWLRTACLPPCPRRSCLSNSCSPSNASFPFLPSLADPTRTRGCCRRPARDRRFYAADADGPALRRHYVCPRRGPRQSGGAAVTRGSGRCGHRRHRHGRRALSRRQAAWAARGSRGSRCAPHALCGRDAALYVPPRPRYLGNQKSCRQNRQNRGVGSLLRG